MISLKFFRYFRCRRYKSSCPGRCVLEDGQVRATTPHSHAPEPDRALVDKFRKVLTQRAQKERTELYTIYWEEATQRHADAAMIYSFTQAESCMRKARRKVPPQLCTTIRELSEILTNSSLFFVTCGAEKENLYKTTITVEDGTCLLFMHYKTLEKIGRVEEMHVDHSIKSEPAPPNFNYSILTVHAVQKNQSYPFAYVVMTKSNRNITTALFAFLKEQFPNISPNNIFSNYDGDMMEALKTVFSEATVRGYYFHFTAAVLNRMKLLKIAKQNKGHVTNGIRMLLVLPLLPSNYMRTGLQAIKKWLVEKKTMTPQLENLCDFIEQQWLIRIGAEKISIFSLSHCVTNHIENFNTELQSTIGISNPIIWNMLEALTHIARQTFTKLTKRSKQLSIPCSNKTPKKGQLIQDTIVSSATQLWLRTPFHLKNPLQFLQVTSHCINDALFTGVEVARQEKVPETTTYFLSSANSPSEIHDELPSFSYSIQSYDEPYQSNTPPPLTKTSLTTISESTTQNLQTNTIQLQPATLTKTQRQGATDMIFPTQTTISLRSLEPPPLVFYPKAFMRKNIIKNSEPPPLIYYKDLAVSEKSS